MNYPPTTGRAVTTVTTAIAQHSGALAKTGTDATALALAVIILIVFGLTTVFLANGRRS